MIRKEIQDDLMKGRVMHNLPGRLRLAAEGLKYLKDESGEIAGELVHIPRRAPLAGHARDRRTAAGIR